MADIEYGVGREDPHEHAGFLTKTFQVFGGLFSIALMIGVGLWSYNLMMRDVSGVPVVRAIEGPMRVQPDDPGGLQTANQGLAVNSVAADGSAADPADTIVLAPQPTGFAPEDTQVAGQSDASVDPVISQAALALAGTDGHSDPAWLNDDPGPLSSENQAAAIQALAAQLAAGAEPLTEAAVAPNAQTVAIIPASIPGVTRSRRPEMRSVQATNITLASASPAAVAPVTNNVDPASIPSGTRLVQLGAFDSPEIAEKEWARLSGRFAVYLQGKSRVVQQAQSGGRTFYRLRAMGFADLADARRFCSALVAENAACIPVVMR
jgi:hypothetical protein